MFRRLFFSFFSCFSNLRTRSASFTSRSTNFPSSFLCVSFTVFFKLSSWDCKRLVSSCNAEFLFMASLNFPRFSAVSISILSLITLFTCNLISFQIFWHLSVLLVDEYPDWVGKASKDFCKYSSRILMKFFISSILSEHVLGFFIGGLDLRSRRLWSSVDIRLNSSIISSHPEVLLSLLVIPSFCKLTEYSYSNE